MALLTITPTDVRLVRPLEMLDGPANTVINAGQICELEATNGKWILADANVSKAGRGMSINTANVANVALTVVKSGIVTVGNALDALNYGDTLWLSETPGALETTDPSQNEVQSVDITGVPTGGTFTLTFMGQTTGAIAFNALAAAVQAALEALAIVGTGGVVVSGTNPAFSVEFTGRWAKYPVPALTADGSGLTGGTAPDVAVTVDTEGAGSVQAAFVIPGHGQSLGSSPDKLLYIDF